MDQRRTKHGTARQQAQLGVVVAYGLRSRELASVADARIRASFVPERAENCGHQRSPTGTANGRPTGDRQPLVTST